MESENKPEHDRLTPVSYLPGVSGPNRHIVGYLDASIARFVVTSVHETIWGAIQAAKRSNARSGIPTFPAPSARADADTTLEE